jgi:HAMP domain-containing protein
MRWIGSLKLSHQILLLLLSIPTLLVVSLLYYSANQHVTIRNKPLEQLALSTSGTVAEKIDRNLNDRYSDVQAFAANKLVQEAFLSPPSDSLLQKFINKLIVYYQCYDLILLYDLSGQLIFTNTIDRNGKSLSVSGLYHQNRNDLEWFRSSIVVGGPPGGAYASDFNSADDVIAVYGNKGYGLDFSTPVRNSQGEIIGVLRNRVSWEAVTQQIRKESEVMLQKNAKGSFILLMDKQGHLIDADQDKNIMKVNIGKNNLFKEFNFDYASIQINEQNFLYGWAESNGFAAYKGNKWKYLTLIPRVKFTDPEVYLRSDWTKLMIFSLTLLLIGTTCSILFVRNFSGRINKIKKSIHSLSKGVPDMIPHISFKDEIGEMSFAINTLSENFRKMAAFSNEIGNGNLIAQFSPLGENDLLGHSLLKMQRNLKFSRQEALQQKWISDHLSSLGELLRDTNIPEHTYQKAISFLAKAVQAHQAAFFIVQHTSVLPEIELKCGYALSDNRLNQPPLDWGENYVGQCIKDNEMIRLKNLPEDYSEKINSGLGECVPCEVLISPIQFNHQSLGAVEFSTLTPFEDYKIRFLEKATEYLGSYMTQVQINSQKASLQD